MRAKSKPEPRARRKVGRPSEFTTKATEAILKLLRQGNFRKAAAEHEGVSSRTMRRWMLQGKADIKAGRTTDHARFVREVKRAEKTAEIQCVRSILMQARLGEWQAAAWYLRHGVAKKRYKSISAQELSGPNGKPIRTQTGRADLSKLTEEEIATMERLLTKAGAEDEGSDEGGSEA